MKTGQAHKSSSTARYNHPAVVGIYVISVTHLVSCLD